MAATVTALRRPALYGPVLDSTMVGQTDRDWNLYRRATRRGHDLTETGEEPASALSSQD